MMALNGLGPVGSVSRFSDTAAAGSARPAPFRARAGRVKRLLRLGGDLRGVGSLGGTLSLLYVRLRTDSRMRDIQKWSDIDRRSTITQDDMRQLLDRITRNCPQPAHMRVFIDIAERYCAHAETGQLAALRRTLGIAGQGAGAWMAGMPRTDASRKAWEALVSMVDSELARRTLITPLRQMIQALPAAADAHALDLACARLAANLHRIGDERMGRGPLVAAMGQLTHAEVRTLALHLAPADTAAPGDAAAYCRMSRALGRARSSPDLWRQRLDLIGVLRTALVPAIGDRMDYFIHATSRLIGFQLQQGKPSQAVYNLAADSLKKSLDTLRYPGWPNAGMGTGTVAGTGTCTGDALVARLIAAALVGKPLEDVRTFVSKLEIRALNDLVQAMEGSNDDCAGAAWLIRGARDARVGSYRTRVADRLHELNRCIDGGARWPIVRALNELALALNAWESHCVPHGLELAPSIERQLGGAVQQASGLLFRGPVQPASTLDQASIQVLCGREVEYLRKSEPRLEKYGLCLDKGALKQVAGERGMPYIAMGVEHVIALIEILAQNEPASDRIVHAVREAAESLAMAYAKCASFVDATSDEALRLSMDIAGAAWDGYAARNPDRLAAARGAVRNAVHILANGLNDAASCLVLDLDEECTNDDEWSSHPASHMASRLRLASQLTEALGVVAVANGEEAVRDASGATFMDDWTPALCKAVAEQFGVHYEPVKGQSSLVMTRTEHDAFAAELLRKEMTVPASIKYEITGSAGPAVVEIDRQLLLDGIDRQFTRFSVAGIDRLGQYVPYISSDPASGEETHVPGVERALVALQQLAGPDTTALSSYLTQSIGADFLISLFELGAQSPIKLADGSPVLPGGDARSHTDLTRLADGSYTLRINLMWDALATVTEIAGKGAGVKLDASQSFASVGCELRLAPTGAGGWRRRVTSPLMVRYRLAPLAT
jgi:hypothetical protein